MTSTTSAAARPKGLDQVLSSAKQTHQLAGCRTCGLMATFAPVQPGKRTI